jgi:hypothetical protein
MCFNRDAPSETRETVTDDDDDDCHIIRAKWTMDGARTLDEAARKLLRYAEYLQSIRNDGWELRSPIEDDYGYVYKDAV